MELAPSRYQWLLVSWSRRADECGITLCKEALQGDDLVSTEV